MTSANRTDDPIITKEEELEQLWTRSLELSVRGGMEYERGS